MALPHPSPLPEGEGAKSGARCKGYWGGQQVLQSKPKPKPKPTSKLKLKPKPKPKLKLKLKLKPMPMPTSKPQA